jgi:hypothetical protein
MDFNKFLSFLNISFKFMNLSSKNHRRIRHIRDLSDFPCVDLHQYFQTNAEVTLKLCWNCFVTRLLSSQNIRRSSIPLKSRIFRSEFNKDFNKDFWCEEILIYFPRIVRRKANRGRKTLSDPKLQVQIMIMRQSFNETSRRGCGYCEYCGYCGYCGYYGYCGYAWMMYILCIFSLLC